MNDPIADAFARVPLVEPAADFDRVVVARARAANPARRRRIQRLLRGYWVAASAVAVAVIVASDASAFAIAAGVGSLAGVAAAATVAAGGIRSIARTLRTTVS
jgi:hypothetical protein